MMPPKHITDTDRLNYLLKYFRIDDVGDDQYSPGIVIDHETLEDILTWGRSLGVRVNQCDRQDFRRIIDMTIYKNE